MKKNIIKILLLLSATTIFSEEITLDNAVEMSLKNSSKIKIKKLEIESKKNSLKSAEADYYPTLKASSSLSKDEDKSSNYGSSISLSQSIFKGGEIRSRVETAKLNLKLSEEEVMGIENSTALETVTLYIAALKTKNQLKIYNNSLEELKKEYEKEKIMYEKNMSSKLDMMNLEISISSADESIFKAESDYKNALEKLKKNILYNGSEEISLKTILFSENIINLDEDIKNYLANSSYIKQKSIEKEQYIAAEKVSDSSYYPDVNLSLSYNSDTNSFSDWNMRAGVSIDYTIWDFGKRKATSSNSKIDLKKYEIESSNDISDKVVEIKAKYEELKAYEKIVISKKEKIKKIEEKFEITKIKYDNRYISSDDFLKDENELQQNRIDVMNAELEYLYRYKEYKNLLL